MQQSRSRIESFNDSEAGEADALREKVLNPIGMAYD